MLIEGWIVGKNERPSHFCCWLLIQIWLCKSVHEARGFTMKIGELVRADVSYNSGNYLIMCKWEQHNGTNCQSGVFAELGPHWRGWWFCCHFAPLCHFIHLPLQLGCHGASLQCDLFITHPPSISCPQFPLLFFSSSSKHSYIKSTE